MRDNEIDSTQSRINSGWRRSPSQCPMAVVAVITDPASVRQIL